MPSSLSSLRFYAHLATGEKTYLGVALQPINKNIRLSESYALYHALPNYSENNMSYIKLGEINGEYTIENTGVQADIALSRKLTSGAYLYIRAPFTYVRITTQPRFWTTLYSMQYGDRYTSPVNKSYTLTGYRESRYSLFPHIGYLARENMVQNARKLFIPFSAQYRTAEISLLDDQSTVYLNYSSYKTTAFNSAIFTGIENQLSGWVYAFTDPSYDNLWYGLSLTTRASLGKILIIDLWDFYSSDDWTTATLLPRMGFRHTGRTWGIAAETSFPTPLREIHVSFWRSWGQRAL